MGQGRSSLGFGFLRSLGHGIESTTGKATPALATHVSAFKIGKVGNVLKELIIACMAVKSIEKECLINASVDAS